MERLALPRRRTLTRLLLAALLVVPLAAPAHAAEDRVTVTGVLTWPDGRLAARQHVELTRVTGLGDAIFGSLFFALTGGFAAALCFDDAASEALVQCGRNTVATRTDAQGRYTFVMDKDVIDRPDRSFTIRARVPRTAPRAPGAQVQVTTRLVVGRNALPSLAVWDPRVSGPLDALSWPRLAGATSYGQSFSSPTGLRHDTGGDPPLDLDPRLLEDTRGHLVLTAHGGTTARPVVWTSPRRAYAGTAGKPLSRQRGCRITVETVAGARAVNGCWLTDGRFSRGFSGTRPQHCYLDPAFSDPIFRQDPTCEYANVTKVEIDLGRVAEVDAILSRGDCDSCEVATSVDHVSWTRPERGTGPGYLVDWEARAARWVRVVGDPYPSPIHRSLVTAPHAKPGGRALPSAPLGDVSGLTELSVWEVPPAAPLASPGSSAQAVTEAPAAQPEDEDGLSPTAVALAVLLVLAVSGGVVLVTVSRS